MIFMGVEWGEGWTWRDVPTGSGVRGYIRRGTSDGSVAVFRELGGGVSIRVTDKEYTGRYLVHNVPSSEALAEYVAYVLKGGSYAAVGD